MYPHASKKIPRAVTTSKGVTENCKWFYNASLISNSGTTDGSGGIKRNNLRNDKKRSENDRKRKGWCSKDPGMKRGKGCLPRCISSLHPIASTNMDLKRNREREKNERKRKSIGAKPGDVEVF